jgi:MFS family permease
MAAENTACINMAESSAATRRLFTGCWIALVATSFAFVIRMLLVGTWQIDFALSETQKGEILGAGLWPFGITIVLFSLIIDRIGYGRAMVFAFLCHAASAFILFRARGYNDLYLGSILNGLAAGTVEAVINPVVASMYTRSKTKMLTILHAGWPAGMVLGGIITLLMGTQTASQMITSIALWKAQVLVVLIPVVLYGIFLLGCKFPKNERVTAGISYKKMLQEAGTLTALLAAALVLVELARVFHFPIAAALVLAAAIAAVYFAYTRSLGRPLYIVMLIVMLMLATTELGIDSWVGELLNPAMAEFNMKGGWVLIYTSTIMMLLRFSIAPIERALRPLGVLLLSSVLAAVGLFFLSDASAAGKILIFATIYGAGKSFFWPVTLGIAAERFPKGGALTLNAIAGIGMLAVGIMGNPMLGLVQDKQVSHRIQTPELAPYAAQGTKQSVFGSYTSLDVKEVNRLNAKVELFNAMKTTDLTTLAAKSDFQALVKNHYDTVVRDPSASLVTRTHDEMLAGLRAAELIITAPDAQRLQTDYTQLKRATREAKMNAMARFAVLPAIMAFCYLGLVLYFRKQGGYKVVDIATERT